MAKLKYKEETQAFWQRHIDAFKLLNTSKAAYAKANNLNNDRWLYWSRKLMKSSSSFVSVKVSPAMTNAGSLLLTVDCPQGFRLSIHRNDVLSYLPQLLSALKK